MANPREYQFNLPKKNRPGDVSILDPWYPGIQKYWSNCTTKRTVDPISGIKAIVIHATAGGSSEGAISVMKRSDEPASFHWLVPDENEEQHGKLIWACVPEALAAWHVRNTAHHPDVNDGARRVNHWSLGVEIVNNQNADEFSDWQIEVTAKLVRYCWAKYPNLEHVVSHAKLDSDRRSDPGAHFDWSKFKSLVLSAHNNELPESVAAAVPASKIKASSKNLCCL
ncbi:N-acetylmuramoyl-L-alanine amidase [Cupriavidus sp. L7L]|uniref:N-acetylmuramoyl-L-alanine amidase n=1 Tax=Cupriavidus sp. L7L TaxID=2546443 RepID=UPI0010547019|nr:N-acetylmuramoyl-L-alanine amidase [Cupriavidus sp. L7L]TDF56781.1 N-acetylmuramoyl-L-alanine amidase [Cupriavidus sp. L7L]